MTTPMLFHGPEARNKALHLSEEVGRPLRDPIGDEGLKVADSRLVVDLAQYPGVGDKPPSLVIGPVDRATPEASDALLKTLEDLSEAPLRIILWANYLSGVRGTIRSRTRGVWCPPGPTTPSPVAHLRDEAKSLCDALLEKNTGKILGILEDVEKGWPELLQAVCEPLSGRLEEPEAIRAWLAIRRVLDGRGTVITAVDALLPEAI